MEAYGGSRAGLFEGWPPWTARIRRTHGDIVGAGVLLSPDRVLTCAHVVGAARTYVAEFPGPGRSEVTAVPAMVLADAFVSVTRDRDGDPRGDVALLRLERPMPAGTAVSLWRLSIPKRNVQLYGFPLDFAGGLPTTCRRRRPPCATTSASWSTSSEGRPPAPPPRPRPGTTARRGPRAATGRTT